MNKVYRSLWNDALGAWIAVQENGRARGKPGRSSRRAIMLSSIATVGMMAASLATAQTTVSGSANNGGSGKTASTDSTCNQNFVNRKNPGDPPPNGSTYMLSNGCSTAVGNNAQATSAGTALGDRANATGGGVALGVGASNTQNSGVAIGPVATRLARTTATIAATTATSIGLAALV